MIIYRGSATPEGKPYSKEFCCMFTTPDLEDAVMYGRIAANDSGSKIFYVHQYKVRKGAKILNFNTDPKAEEVISQFAGKELGSEEEYNRIMQHAVEFASCEFVEILRSRGYAGYSVDRFTEAGHLLDRILCVFDPKDVILEERLSSRYRGVGFGWEALKLDRLTK